MLSEILAGKEPTRDHLQMDTLIKQLQIGMPISIPKKELGTPSNGLVNEGIVVKREQNRNSYDNSNTNQSAKNAGE